MQQTLDKFVRKESSPPKPPRASSPPSVNQASSPPSDDHDSSYDNELLDELAATIKDVTWQKFFKRECKKSYFQKLLQKLEDDYESKDVIYPPKDRIFRAFSSPNFYDIKVVIIGQDPYHNPGQANGFCFAVNADIAPPPSLRNIFGSIKNLGRGCDVSPSQRTLEHWADQGVFLLNSILTVDGRKKALSHRSYGWETFTDNAMEYLGKQRKDIVWLLMGRSAQAKAKFAQKDNIVMCAHPSPLSAHRFFPHQPFQDVNKRLQELGNDPVQWIETA